MGQTLESSSMPPSFYEFFAGAGLVRLGLSPAWKCLWANDIDERKAAVYTENFPNSRFEPGDVSEVNPASLPPGAQLAWASFPCQDLSLAGWRRGMAAERSGTFWAFWRILQARLESNDRPPMIVLENVPGLLYGENLTGLCEALAALNMTFGGIVIDARYFVPQSRPRVFVVAVDSRVSTRSLASELPREDIWFPDALRRAFTRLPLDLRELWRWWRLPVPATPVKPFAELVEREASQLGWHSISETQHLLSLMSPVNLRKVESVAQMGRTQIGFLYRRTRAGRQRAEVRFDGIAGCLRTPEGGSSRQTLIFVDRRGVRSRLLSPREAARLMGVPDSFVLPERYNDAYRAMGDGVAVPVVRWLSEHLLEPLARRASRADRSLRKLDESAYVALAVRRRRAAAQAALWRS